MRLLLDVDNVVADALELDAGLERVLAARGYVECRVAPRRRRACTGPACERCWSAALLKPAALASSGRVSNAGVGARFERVPDLVRNAEIHGVVLQVVHFAFRKPCSRRPSRRCPLVVTLACSTPSDENCVTGLPVPSARQAAILFERTVLP